MREMTIPTPDATYFDYTIIGCAPGDTYDLHTLENCHPIEWDFIHKKKDAEAQWKREILRFVDSDFFHCKELQDHWTEEFIRDWQAILTKQRPDWMLYCCRVSFSKVCLDFCKRDFSSKGSLYIASPFLQLEFSEPVNQYGIAPTYSISNNHCGSIIIDEDFGLIRREIELSLKDPNRVDDDGYDNLRVRIKEYACI